MKQKAINIGKNILLVFLTLLMAALTVLIWVRSLSWEDIPVESGFGQLYMRLAYGSASAFGLRTEETPASYPIEIAVRINDEMYGAQYDESGVDALYEPFQDQISSALSDPSIKLLEGTEDAYREALQQDCIYFRYQDALPIDILVRWLGDTKWDKSDLTVVSFLFSAKDKVWIRDETGNLYYFIEEINSSDWSSKVSDSIFQSCTFFVDIQDTEPLHPETLVFSERKQAYSVLEMITPDYFDSNGTDNLQVVLEAFEYNASAGNYMDDSTRIFVNNNSTLRVGQNGEIEFHATSLEGGIEAYQENEVTDNSEMILRVGVAKSILEQVQKSYTSEAAFYLSAINQDEASGRVQLRFRYLCNGVPVVGDAGHYATIEFLENTLVSAEIKSCIFLSSDEQQYLVPCEQLVKMAGENDYGVLIGYFEESDVLRPQRYFERAV